jgi:hypothetical protein
MQQGHACKGQNLLPAVDYNAKKHFAGSAAY